jgi:hypothetical protein
MYILCYVYKVYNVYNVCMYVCKYVCMFLCSQHVSRELRYINISYI